MGRNLLLLTGLLCIAVALGIGIGVLVASLKPQPPPTRAINVPAQSALRQRFLDLKRDLEAKKSRGEPVPQEAWELMASASSAMIEGNDSIAEEKIAEAERLLKE